MIMMIMMRHMPMLEVLIEMEMMMKMRIELSLDVRGSHLCCAIKLPIRGRIHPGPESH